MIKRILCLALAVCMIMGLTVSYSIATTMSTEKVYEDIYIENKSDKVWIESYSDSNGLWEDYIYLKKYKSIAGGGDNAIEALVNEKLAGKGTLNMYRYYTAFRIYRVTFTNPNTKASESYTLVGPTLADSWEKAKKAINKNNLNLAADSCYVALSINDTGYKYPIAQQYTILGQILNKAVEDPNSLLYNAGERMNAPIDTIAYDGIAPYYNNYVITLRDLCEQLGLSVRISSQAVVSVAAPGVDPIEQLRKNESVNYRMVNNPTELAAAIKEKTDAISKNIAGFVKSDSVGYPRAINEWYRNNVSSSTISTYKKNMKNFFTQSSLEQGAQFDLLKDTGLVSIEEMFKTPNNYLTFAFSGAAEDIKNATKLRNFWYTAKEIKQIFVLETEDGTVRTVEGKANINNYNEVLLSKEIEIDGKEYVHNESKLTNSPKTVSSWDMLEGEYTGNELIVQMRGRYEYIYTYYTEKNKNIPLDIEVTDIEGAIRATDNKYDVTQGIPSGEKVYTEINLAGVLIKGQYEAVEGSKVFKKTAEVKVAYTDGNGQKGELLYTKELANEVKSYSYNRLNTYGVYKADSAIIKNGALPQNSLLSNTENITATYNKGGVTSIPEDIVIKGEIELTTAAVPRGSSTAGELAQTDLTAEDIEKVEAYITNELLIASNGQANINIGEYETKDDTITYTIGANSYSYSKETIEEIEEKGTQRITLTEVDLTIPAERKNGEYLSPNAEVSYSKLIASNEQYKDKLFGSTEVNKVVVHTPVYAEVSVNSDNSIIQTTTKTNNNINLDKAFTVNLVGTGPHLDILGYKTRDYSKYGSYRIRFSTDVYVGKDSTGAYVKANTWIDTKVGETEYYMPLWTKEGQHTIEVEATAINAGESIGREEKANKKITNTHAVHSIDINVSGNLYGFRIGDITDYPDWQLVFRKTKETAEHSGYYYWTGGTSILGETRIGRGLPIIQGSHPTDKLEGILKTGYGFKFELNSTGDYTGENDYIEIIPHLEYVSEDGRTRKEVDIYYHEVIDGEQNYYVKLGASKIDLANKKQMLMGNIYRNVPEQEIVNSANLTGVSESTYKKRLIDIGTYGKILLNNTASVFNGDSLKRPSNITAKRILSLEQTWYGDYFLPSQMFVCEKGYKLPTGALSIDGREDFWIKDGYIMVNFDIRSYRNGKQILSYYKGANDNSNMWKKEGFVYSKTDSLGVKHSFRDGDIVFYYTNRSMEEDFATGGR